MKVYIGDLTKGSSEELLTALGKIGLVDSLGRSSKVFVKPNFTFPRPVPGVTTSPEFLRGVLGILADTGADVLVGESNGGYGSFLASDAFNGHGLLSICNQTKTTLVDLSRSEARSYTASVEGRKTTVLLPRFLVDDVDVTVSVPVLKVHAMTTVSLSVKNLWGCVPSDLRLLEHATMSRKLALIVNLIKARYGVIDATYGLDQHGPMQGKVRKLGKVIAGEDLYGLDWVATKMMGFNPSRIQHLRHITKATQEAIRRGEFQSNTDFELVNWHFRLGLDVIDTLSLACFRSNAVAKVVFDSPLTRPIYALLGREPRRKIT